jgi:hypothetical protein
MRLNSDLRRSAHKVLNSHGKSWCPGAESNHRHRDFQSRALPTELPGRRPRNEGSRGAGRYRGWVGPCPATDWAPARPCLRRPSVRLVIARTGLAHLIIVLLRRRNRVPAAQPAMQVDIGAAPRAERAKLLDVRLAADRAGLRGLGGRIQWVGLSCGNRQPRCRRPVGWHLWRLHDGCICLHDGIYGVCATDATPLCDGIYGRRWYLRRLHHVAASLCDGMASGRFHRQMPSRVGMASMGGNGIYGACTALPPPCAMASMA